MNTLTGENILQMVCHLLHVLIGIHSDNQIEMGIDKLLALSGNDLLHLLNILNSHLVRWVGDRGMTVLLLIEHSQLSLLVGKENNLIIDDRINLWNMVYLTHQVNRHNGIVHRHIDIRTENTRQAHRVHIQQAIDLGLTVTHMNLFTVNLEVCHGDILIPEIHGKETVGILTSLTDIEETGRLNAAVM